jgi:hypothetical protein
MKWTLRLDDGARRKERNARLRWRGLVRSVGWMGEVEWNLDDFGKKLNVATVEASLKF